MHTCPTCRPWVEEARAILGAMRDRGACNPLPDNRVIRLLRRVAGEAVPQCGGIELEEA